MNKSIGDWCFEITQVRARKVKDDGYTSIATISIVNGEPHIEGLLCKDEFKIRDYKSFREFLIGIGFNTASITRFKNNIRTKLRKLCG